MSPSDEMSVEVPSADKTLVDINPSEAGFFEEDNGKKSSMRLMSFTALLASILFGLLTLSFAGAGPDGVYITFGFLLAAFAPKTLQKFAEQKVN